MTGDASVHAENHGTMNPHQAALEGVLIASFDESLEQLAIGRRLGVGEATKLRSGILPSEKLHQSLSASSRGQLISAISEKSLEPDSLTPPLFFARKSPFSYGMSLAFSKNLPFFRRPVSPPEAASFAERSLS